MNSHLLTDKMKEQFQRQGYLLIKNFYDVEEEIDPIRRHIYDLILVLKKKYQVSMSIADYSPENFDASFLDLIKVDRRIGSVLYDAIKQSPFLMRLVCHPKHDAIMKMLREGSSPGVCGNGFGVRIDIPGETQYEAPWHQEFPTQMRSQDGLIFWTPLIRMTREMGPVKLCVGSHQYGPIDVEMDAEGGQSGAYALRLANESEVVSRYAVDQPLAEPGDVLLVDWMTIHASARNQSRRARWSIQSRYFNFSDPLGVKLEWRGSFSEGKNIQKYLQTSIDYIKNEM